MKLSRKFDPEEVIGTIIILGVIFILLVGMILMAVKP